MVLDCEVCRTFDTYNVLERRCIRRTDLLFRSTINKLFLCNGLDAREKMIYLLTKV